MGQFVRMAVMLLLTGLSFVGAATGGGKAAWFVFGCVAGLLATGLVAGFALRGRITVERTLPRQALRGGHALRVEGRVTVPFRFPLVFVWLADTWLNERTGRTVRGACLIVPMGRTRLRYAYHLPALERGVYRLKQTETGVADFFDLAGFRRRRSVAVPDPAAVGAVSTGVPAEATFVVGPLAAHLCGEQADAARREDPVSAGGVRQYAEGDPVGRIHWKSTLRYGRLMVVTADEGEEPTARLVLDSGSDESQFERALGAAAAFLHSLDGDVGRDGTARMDVLLAVREGELLSLAVHGRETMLRRLALLQRDALPEHDPLRRLPDDQRYIVASGRLDHALAELVERLARINPVMTLVATGDAPPGQAELRIAERLLAAGIEVQLVRIGGGPEARDGGGPVPLAGKPVGM